MKLLPINYPRNRAEAIKITRPLEAEWAFVRIEKDKNGRHKRLIKIVKVVKDILSFTEKINDIDDRSDVQNIITSWARKHNLVLR